jgi:hypothetical protein
MNKSSEQTHHTFSRCACPTPFQEYESFIPVRKSTSVPSPWKLPMTTSLSPALKYPRGGGEDIGLPLNSPPTQKRNPHVGRPLPDPLPPSLPPRSDSTSSSGRSCSNSSWSPVLDEEKTWRCRCGRFGRCRWSWSVSRSEGIAPRRGGLGRRKGRRIAWGGSAPRSCRFVCRDGRTLCTLETFLIDCLGVLERRRLGLGVCVCCSVVLRRVKEMFVVRVCRVKRCISAVCVVL